MSSDSTFLSSTISACRDRFAAADLPLATDGEYSMQPCCDGDWQRGEHRQAGKRDRVSHVGRCATEQPATQQRGQGDECAEPEEMDHRPAGDEPQIEMTRRHWCVHGQYPKCEL